ncbi:putative spermidine/putrescine transport system permease protein [Enhydrobacter aerosaccus]|uniref:Putative spermidine/putrescine transport system permease protein n=1 Tax=Enhydrobacter aerosaccus TaxID=225324 RepID=A0A1T4SRA4_9HYPH|nr:ABC transporter permease [Enhydrobacter aerosaccus]SKA30686.1 putative spermidine/putrescine transport system permease protein [Enhydrobacter aerosaccus]
MSRDRRLSWMMIAPALLLVTVLFFAPLVRVLMISVTEPTPGLGNYALLFTSASIQRTLLTTLRICVFTTAITLVLAYAVAYVLTHARPAAQRLMLLGVLLPLWMSVLVRAFAWVTLLRREGLLNKGLMSLGLIDHPLALMWNETGVTIGMVHYMLPLGILPLWSAMRGIDGRVLAAARGLGAGRVQTFGRVFLPLSLPGVIGAGLLVFIFSLGFFITPAILGGGKTIMVAEYIDTQIQESLRWGVGTMIATTLIATIFLLMFVLGRIVDLRTLFGAK